MTIKNIFSMYATTLTIILCLNRLYSIIRLFYSGRMTHVNVFINRKNIFYFQMGQITVYRKKIVVLKAYFPI